MSVSTASGAAHSRELVEPFQSTIGRLRLDVALEAGDRAETLRHRNPGAFLEPLCNSQTGWNQAGSSSTPLNPSPIQVPAISYSFDIVQLAVVASRDVSGPAAGGRRAAVDAWRRPGGAG